MAGKKSIVDTFQQHTRTETCYERLATAIIKQACMDFYRDCDCPDKPRKRPHKKINGKRGELMTDIEFAEWLEDLEKDRLARRREELNFFHSEWYLILSRHNDFDLIDTIIREIERKRESGLPLFDPCEKTLAKYTEMNE